MTKALLGAKRFIFLAIACGLGKTLCFLVASWIVTRRLQREKKTTLHKPMMLLTLSQLIPDAFQQAQMFTGGLFEIYVCYGDERRTKDAEMRNCILSKAEFASKIEELALRRHDPRVRGWLSWPPECIANRYTRPDAFFSYPPTPRSRPGGDRKRHV